MKCWWIIINTNIRIITGFYGCGKSEISVNLALKAIEEGKKCTIVDLDIVNPFFRSGDVKDILINKGIEVILPNFIGSNLDVSSLSGNINSIFCNDDKDVIIDVGGSESGAKVLAVYKEKIIKNGYKMNFVINLKREDSNNCEKIKEMIYNVEKSSGLKVTSIINNTNLKDSTNIDIVNKGMIQADKIFENDSLLVEYNVVSSLFKEYNFEKSFNKNLFFIDRYIKAVWE